MENYEWILLYLVILNLAGFCSMGIDKKRARERKWRISERDLILVAVFGGSVGSLLGMKKFRHKTKHPKFYIGIPVILVLQGALAIWAWVEYIK